MKAALCAGAGLGLRIPHIQDVLRDKPAIPWFEVHICNFLRGGLNRALLERIAEDYALSFHGVSLNIGGSEPLDTDYLLRLKAAIDLFEPELVSEHACFTALAGQHFHDLLPVPYNDETLKHFVERIDAIQQYLGRKILLENVSRYTQYPDSMLSEAQFLHEVSRQSGCGILLDINNAYVNQVNLAESFDDFIAALPFEAIGEIHLAGHSQGEDYLVDTHSQAVCEAVWDCYRQFNRLCPGIPCLIEWDNDLPSFERLHQEQVKAQAIILETSVGAASGSLRNVLWSG